MMGFYSHSRLAHPQEIGMAGVRPKNPACLWLRTYVMNQIPFFFLTN
jgi:hypothetical protein